MQQAKNTTVLIAPPLVAFRVEGQAEEIRLPFASMFTHRVEV